MKRVLVGIFCLSLLSGCMSPAKHHGFAIRQASSAECSSHGNEIDCDWNVAD